MANNNPTLKGNNNLHFLNKNIHFSTSTMVVNNFIPPNVKKIQKNVNAVLMMNAELRFKKENTNKVENKTKILTGLRQRERQVVRNLRLIPSFNKIIQPKDCMSLKLYSKLSLGMLLSINPGMILFLEPRNQLGAFAQRTVVWVASYQLAKEHLMLQQQLVLQTVLKGPKLQL